MASTRLFSFRLQILLFLGLWFAFPCFASPTGVQTNPKAERSADDLPDRMGEYQPPQAAMIAEEGPAIQTPNLPEPDFQPGISSPLSPNTPAISETPHHNTPAEERPIFGILSLSFGIACNILPIFAVLLSLPVGVLIIGWLTLAVLAVVFGIIGLGRKRRKRYWALAGLILGGLTLLGFLLHFLYPPQFNFSIF